MSVIGISRQLTQTALANIIFLGCELDGGSMAA